MLFAKTDMYEDRFYRKTFTDRWHACEINIGQTDILVKTEDRLDKSYISNLIKRLRSEIEEYISRFPEFETSLLPVRKQEPAGPIIQEMIEKTALVGTGPMSSVAGAIAEFMGRRLASAHGQFIVENGGDIWMKKQGDIFLGVYAGFDNPINDFLLKIPNKNGMLGVCSSSSVLGHSLSLGSADLVTVISESAIFADALATKIANRVCTDADVDKETNMAKQYELTRGVMIVRKDKIGLWGGINLVHK